MRRIANADLRMSDIPADDAIWDEIEDFALTYDCYQHEDCAEIANERREDSFDDLRTCLSFEQRRWRHFGDVPEGEDMLYIRGLVRQIRNRVEAAG